MGQEDLATSILCASPEVSGALCSALRGAQDWGLERVRVWALATRCVSALVLIAQL